MYQRLLPVVTLFVVVVLAVQPWGLSSAGRLAIGLLPGLTIFYWAARRDRTLSAVGVSVMGLICDVAGGGVIGHWALVYLVALGVSVGLHGALRRGFVLQIVGLLSVGVAMVFTIAVLSLLVSGHGMSAWTAIYGTSYAVMAFGPIYVVLRMLEGHRGQSVHRFERWS